MDLEGIGVSRGYRALGKVGICWAVIYYMSSKPRLSARLASYLAKEG